MAGPQQSATSRRSRGFSVKSESSHKTNTSGHKSHLSESSQEKAKLSLHTKADPTVAMNELQPMAVALEKSNMGSLRAMQHKDQFGNPITDPDWSNPTRPRFERPLDTIRSFEAAIHGTYASTRPTSYIRTDDAASQMGDYSRRTSYHAAQNNNGYSNRGYADQNGYYNRNTQSRPDSMIDAYGGSSQAPDNYYPYNQNGNGNGNGNGRRPRHTPRSSDQAYANGNGNGGQYAYQQHNYQRSYDNVTAMSGSGSGSGYTDSYGQSTDPSSLNSSMDQLQQQALQHQRLDDRAQAEYGYQGYGAGPNMNGQGKSFPSPPAAVADPSWGGASSGAAPANGHLRKTPTANVKAQEKGEKRKSWFKKRFSKG